MLVSGRFTRKYLTSNLAKRFLLKRIVQMKRRDFIKTGTAMAAGLPFLGFNQQINSKNKANKRTPNLLFIFTDEQRADTLSAYGDSSVIMPNLNALAEKSYIFENCYVTSPVCTPSRASILTGLFPTATGAFMNNAPLDKDCKCLPELLPKDVRRKYRTAYHGKWHLGDEIFAQHGFDEWVGIEDFYTDHYSKGNSKSERSAYHHWLVKKGFKPDRKTNKFSRSMAAHLPEKFTKAAFLAETATDFITENKDNPFILYVNFLEPHMPFHGPLTGLYDPFEIDLPDNFDHEISDDDILRVRILAEGFRRNGEGQYDLSTEAGWRQLIAAYRGLCTLVDRSVGKILQSLKNNGLEDNTIVVFTSDHGDMMGSHKLAHKTLFYKESATVPYLLHLPKQTGSYRVKGLSSNVDMAPTLIDAMGFDVPENLHGKSLFPRLQKSDITLTDDVFLQWNDTQEYWRNIQKTKGLGFIKWKTDMAGGEDEWIECHNEELRTIVTNDGWRFTVSPVTHDHELFNLNDDPQERKNLAKNEKYKKVMNKLLEKIKKWQQEIGDTLPLPATIEIN